MVNETLLALHLLAAFATVTSIVMFVAVLVGARRAQATTDALAVMRLSNVAAILWNVGGITVLIFGVWLALDADQYDILDGWILAAIVLWVVASAAGGPLTRAYRDALGTGGEAALAAVRSQRTVVLHAVMALATLALLIVMIYKPGA
jgi:hypothetical protein